jgi:nucleoside-diphosphate-sugar epimerase
MKIFVTGGNGFIGSSEEQIRAATEAFAEELQKINPKYLAFRPSDGSRRKAATPIGA